MNPFSATSESSSHKHEGERNRDGGHAVAYHGQEKWTESNLEKLRARYRQKGVRRERGGGAYYWELEASEVLGTMNCRLTRKE